MKTYVSVLALVAGVATVGLNNPHASAQSGAVAPDPTKGIVLNGRNFAAFDESRPAKLSITEAKGRYRVQEQLMGLSVLSDAVGTTDAVTGTLVIAPNGAFTAPSKITVDLKSLRSDQDLRDNYLRNRVLETEKFPTLEFVPKRAEGLRAPLPGTPEVHIVAFQMVGDMTLHGITKESSWNVVATMAGEAVAGHATVTFLFSTYNLMKPSVPLVLSSDDKIQLEVEFKCVRSAL